MPLANRAFGFLAALALSLAAGGAAAQQAARIAAASDLKFALEEIAAVYRSETGKTVKLTFGSSGNIFQQLRQGAPFDLFMSADEAFVAKLADAGLTTDRGAVYAVGRIVLFAPHGSPLTVDARFEGLQAVLTANRLTRFAIANPEHAPYGRRAMEALKHAGLWDAVKPKLVLGENISQAAQFATSGSADGGIIAYSLALAPQVSRLGTYALIPESWHAPLRQRMVLMKRAGPEAQSFYTFLQQPAARRILTRFGFLLPGEAR